MGLPETRPEPLPSSMIGKAQVRLGDGKAVGRAKAEQDDEAVDHLLKPSPPFVAGLT
jgi:hypothetical protein